MNIDFQQINKIDYKCFNDIIVSNEYDTRIEFYGLPGKQHYRLLSYLSTLYNDSVIIDIGSHRGSSALALSYNTRNNIISYDIVDNIKNDQIKTRSNINFTIQNIFADFNLYKDVLLTAPIILLDIDPHHGHMEYQLYQWLKNNNYQGLLVCDDIWHFEGMRNNFWYLVEDNYKFDVTEYGHWSGTGIITFNQNYINTLNTILKPSNDNWTLVTAYFNLTKCPDASAEIKARDQNYYLQNGVSTLSLPNNLVIYCDLESYDLIYQIRPSYLRNKTKYIICEFDEFMYKDKDGLKFKEYRDIINQNRKNKPYHFDSRNTASYYLFCMARYHMLKETITENSFNSTHFAWINICIQRMGINNVKLLPLALSQNRNKFSTTYIDYIPKSLVENNNEYWLWGRTSQCSGFFTGNNEYMYQVCDLIIDKFLYYLKLERGHADEQLYSPVYFDHPELFEHYYGDYQEMISSYVYSHDNPEKIVYNFIRNSYKHDQKKCLEACEFLLTSLKMKKCTLSADYFNELSQYYMKCKTN
jgi:hypothetical protein